MTGSWKMTVFGGGAQDDSSGFSTLGDIRMMTH